MNILEQDSQPCIFCRIVSGNAKSHNIYENDKILVFLDINPIGIGHTLIIPKEHYENIHDIPEEILIEICKLTKKVCRIQKKIFNPSGIQVIQNNGKAAGQMVFHYHTHTITKNETQSKIVLNPEQMESITQKMKEEFNNDE